MEISEQIERIKEKLGQLRAVDTEFSAYGAERHHYQLNPTGTEQELADFEAAHSIRLPAEYREFLKRAGNGGAGPYLGLEPIERGIFADLDRPSDDDLLDPSQPFPHTQAWNMEFEDPPPGSDKMAIWAEQDEQYFDRTWVNGALRIANAGCGTYSNLVVNGPEYGHVWFDGRASDGGILPEPPPGGDERIGFLDWYESWLDKELDREIDGELGERRAGPEAPDLG